MCTHVIYNNNILAHSKCGTKYLDELFGIHWEKSGQDNIKSPSELLDSGRDIKYIIIRNPKEHFLSAVDTLLSNDNLYVRSIHKIHDDYINNTMKILHNNMDQHWCSNYYKYIFMLSNVKKITLVQLNDLSDFVEMELNLPKLDYTTSHGGRKQTFDELEKMCKESNPEFWEVIEKTLSEEMYFYDKLINENTVFNKKK